MLRVSVLADLRDIQTERKLEPGKALSLIEDETVFSFLKHCKHLCEAGDWRFFIVLESMDGIHSFALKEKFSKKIFPIDYYEINELFEEQFPRELLERKIEEIKMIYDDAGYGMYVIIR